MVADQQAARHGVEGGVVHIKGIINPGKIELTPSENPLHALTVFLSYSHADRITVLRAYDELKQQGLRVWLDNYELPVGAYIFDEVKRGLDTSDAALLFLSAHSAKSSWLSFEGAFFHGANPAHAIIPIVLDNEGKTLANVLPFTNGRLYIDMSDPSKQDLALKLLADQVKQALHKS